MEQDISGRWRRDRTGACRSTWSGPIPAWFAKGSAWCWTQQCRCRTVRKIASWRPSEPCDPLL